MRSDITLTEELRFVFQTSSFKRDMSCISNHTEQDVFKIQTLTVIEKTVLVQRYIILGLQIRDLRYSAGLFSRDQRTENLSIYQLISYAIAACQDSEKPKITCKLFI